MQKLNALRKIVDSGVVAVIRTHDAEKAEAAAQACADGGLESIEVTFTVPRAHRAIEVLSARFEGSPIILGAGTVLDPETARVAILSGARFIVSPAFDLQTARLCQRYQVPYLPGAQTVTEIVHAIESGGDIIKVFPGETLGPSFIKAVRAALPHLPLMPTGGVSVENAADWIRAGSVALGVGGSLTAGAATGDYASITRMARQFVERIAEARRTK